MCYESDSSSNLNREDIHRSVQPPRDYAPPYEDKKPDKKPVSTGVAATVAVIIAFSVMGYIMLSTGGVPL